MCYKRRQRGVKALTSVYIVILIFILMTDSDWSMFIQGDWPIKKKKGHKISPDGINRFICRYHFYFLNYILLPAILYRFWRQHPTKQQQYGHIPHITKTIQIRRTRHAGHCWRSRYKLLSDVLVWTPPDCQAKAGRPFRNYIQQLIEDTGCIPEDLSKAMNDREMWRERVRDIYADGTTRW